MTSEDSSPLKQAGLAAHGDPRPHVVMIVANDVSADTRVRKMAHDVAASGPRVTVLGISPTDDRQESFIGQAALIRLPLILHRRDPKRSRMSRLTDSRHFLAERIRAERQRYFLHQRHVAAEIGQLRARHFAERARAIEMANQREKRRKTRAKRRKERIEQTVERISGLSGVLSRPIRKLLVFWLRAKTKLGHLRSARASRRIEKLLPKMDKKLHRREASMRRGLSSEYTLHLKKVESLEAQLDARGKVRWKAFRRMDWRRELPELHDYDHTFGPVLDAMEPDVIHVHDIHLLGVASRSVDRAHIAGKGTKLIYDAHEYIQGLSRYSERTRLAWSALEREYIDKAAAVVTVSPQLADLLKGDYSLSRDPTLVMNIPVADSAPTSVSLRDAASVPEGVPLIVYSGGLDHSRGVHTLIRAIGELEGVHLALVCKAGSKYIDDLVDEAKSRGFQDRIHIAPFVDPHQVVSYLRSATVAVHPLVTGPMNHEIALPNKLFEYMHAGLPMVVSDCKAMSDLITELGIGEVFHSEDVNSLTEVLGGVISNREKYLRAYANQPDLPDRYSWSKQRRELLSLYQELLGRDAVEVDPMASQFSAVEFPQSRRVKLGIGPFNQAGQGWEWARTVERNFPGVQTEVFEIHRPIKIPFPADLKIPGASWRSLSWQLEWTRRVAGEFTHLLLESGFGVLGTLNGGRLIDDLAFLKDKNIEVAAVLHGSEVRDPVRHQQLVASSPFENGSPLTERMRINTASTLRMLDDFNGPVFVSTLDLLDYVPNGIWLPQVVSLSKWQPRPLQIANGRPKVLFVPTNSTLKGGSFVEEIGGRLQEEGVIDLLVTTGVRPEEMPALMAESDVLIDGLVLGLYGTTSVEGMATGRIVLANLSRVTGRQPEDPPIVDVTPENLEHVLRDIAKSPDSYRRLAESGPDFVRRFHDGRYSAQQLGGFLGFKPSTNYETRRARHLKTESPAAKTGLDDQ